MATVAGAFSFRERRPDRLSGTPRAGFIDRWIFVFMAAWLILIVLVGFIPDAIMKVGLVRAGLRPPFPLVMHAHAVLMGSFMLLLFAQAWLMATGRRELHMKVGIAAFALVPLLVLAGFILAPTMYHQLWDTLQSAPAEARAQLQQRLGVVEDILLLQIRAGILFPAFVAIGLKARAGNAGVHKRMMFLAPAAALGAAIDRMTWLPNTLPASAVGSDLWEVAAISPLLIWDIVRNRRIHEAYWIWLALSVPAALVVYSLWDKRWWHATAKHIMGV